MVPWAHPSPHSKRDVIEFSRFCRAQDRDSQRDRPTDRPYYSVCSNRPHLLRGLATQPNNTGVSVYGAVVMTVVIAEVHPVHLMNADPAPCGLQPSNRANQLGCRLKACAATVHIYHDHLLWSPYVIGQTIIFLPCSFFLILSSIFFFFLT